MGLFFKLVRAKLEDGVGVRLGFVVFLRAPAEIADVARTRASRIGRGFDSARELPT